MRGMGGGSSSPPDESPATRESPSEILERRLAEGEISVEEYEERRRALVDESPLTAAGTRGGRR